MSDPRGWYAGIDWATESHQAWLTDSDGRRLGEKNFKHSGQGLRELGDWLLATSGADGPGQIHVAIEVPHGPVVEALVERGFELYSINPKQLDRFRDRFFPSGVKDDSRDAAVLASALRTDPQCLRHLGPADPVVVELRQWSRIAEELGEDRMRSTSRMRDQLWRYYPAFLKLDADLASPWLLELWQLVPTPDKARSVRETLVADILRRYRVRRYSAADVIRILRDEPLTTLPATAKAARAHIMLLIPRIRLLNEQIRQAYQQIDELVPQLSSQPESEPGQVEQRDAEILASLPGVGRIVLATLLAEAWPLWQRRDYHALRTLAGVAPVTKKSGKSRIVIRRLARNLRLSNALYHWARVAIQNDTVARAKYHALKERGHSHGRAIRSIGDYLLNVACSMLRSRTTFDPSRSTKAA
jgi:transposase